MTFSAAGERQNKTNSGENSKSFSNNNNRKEKQKTLSDQIIEGKYGLIEKELFKKTLKAPGVISYKINTEIPNDNLDTLGGLEKKDIWLSEDSLLVLKGGVLNEKSTETSNNFKPIDSFEAPKRPVKIPLNPKFPPPFPVNFEDRGPLYFIGHDKHSLSNPNKTSFFSGLIDRKWLAQNNSLDTKYRSGGVGAKNFTIDHLHEVIPPKWIFQKTDRNNNFLKQFQSNPTVPNQSFNRTQDLNEDDPSVFYPPAYSFFYKINNTNLVGPLVPGVVLPPPPNFFAVYDPDENNKPLKTHINVINRIENNRLNDKLLNTTQFGLNVTKHSNDRKSFKEFGRIANILPTISPIFQTKALDQQLDKSRHLKSSELIRDSLRKSNSFDMTTLNPILTSQLDSIYHPLKTMTSSTTTDTPHTIKKSYNHYFTQTNPIYFEFFDSTTANPIKNSIANIGSIKRNDQIYISNSRANRQHPFKNMRKKMPKTLYQPKFVSMTNHERLVDTNFFFSTTADLRSIAEPPQNYRGNIRDDSINLPISHKQKPLVLEPIGKFNHEFSAIRQTLNLYKNIKPYIQERDPHVKAVYEFSFEASNRINQGVFDPMVSQNQNNHAPVTDSKGVNLSHKLIKETRHYQTSTESPTRHYRERHLATMQIQAKKNIERSSLSEMAYGQKIKTNANYYRGPFFKEKEDLLSAQLSEKFISYPIQKTQNNENYRINNKNIKYHTQNQGGQQEQKQTFGQADEVASLLNDTIVNYKNPQRPLNPFSEFIDVSRFPFQENIPFISHNPTNSHHRIYAPPYSQKSIRQPLNQKNPFEMLNIEYPHIPQINPESVHITFYNRPKKHD